MGCSVSEIRTTGMYGCGNQFKNIQDEHVQRLTNKFNDALRDYLIKNLEAIGHTFENESDFMLFCKENITQHSIEDCVYLYLPDLTLIGKFSKNITINQNEDFVDGLFTISIG